jgi:glycosyltransferase involved in cell wall biosynthesis
MRVSIVIPVYNGANYLREAIDSALAQTHPDTEVLVVNDGSTDGGATEAIARSYGERIRYVAKPNGGVSSALNRGIAEMSGEWFCWLSHDDRFLPEKTAAQVAFVRAHQDARVVACNFDIIDETGAITGEYRMSIEAVRTGLELLDTWVFGCALMIHRDALAAAGPFDESNRTTQDLEMWLRLLERDPIWWVDAKLCQVRQHAEAGSRTESRYGRDKDELFARMLQRYDATFFDPSATTAEARARTLFAVAVDAIRRESWGGARVALDLAWREQRSLRNPAFLAHLLGPRGIARVWRARGFVVGKTKNVLRRLF